MWGYYKDRINELAMEKYENALVFDELKITLDDQIKIFVNSKARISVLESSTVCSGTEIVDSDADNFVGKKFTVDCDDDCSAVPDP